MDLIRSLPLPSTSLFKLVMLLSLAYAGGSIISSGLNKLNAQSIVTSGRVDCLQTPDNPACK